MFWKKQKPFIELVYEEKNSEDCLAVYRFNYNLCCSVLNEIRVDFRRRNEYTGKICINFPFELEEYCRTFETVMECKIDIWAIEPNEITISKLIK